MSPRFTHARTCRGRIARLRVAVPEDEGRYCLYWIDETDAADESPRMFYGRVDARGPDASGEPQRSLAALEAMIALAAPATLGLFAGQGEDNDDLVHWVVADGNDLALVPPPRALLIDRAVTGSLRWLPAFAIACAVAAMSLWLMIGTSIAFVVSCTMLVTACVAMMITGIGLYEHAATLFESRRHGGMIRASESALRRARAQARERPAPLAPESEPEPDDPVEDDWKEFDPFPARRPAARGRKRRGVRHGR